ncbi:MAG: Abi family protein [Clostridiales bacterium]|nr:Abi family protein [Clostridiales bacterium]
MAFKDIMYADSIKEMKELNIIFEKIDEDHATSILSSEINYSKLMNYAVLFDRYKNAKQDGQFMKIDFFQLYTLSRIDHHLRQIIMMMALDIEQALKVKLISDHISIGEATSGSILEFWELNDYYLNERYRKDNLSSNIQAYLLKCKGELKCLPLGDFLEVVQFGTLQKYAQFFYAKFSTGKDLAKKKVLFYQQLNRILVLRNIAAHNNPLLPFLIEPYAVSNNPYKDYELLSFLGRGGLGTVR